MKNIFKNILIAASLVGTFSCQSLVEGESVSPNDPLEAPSELVMPSSQLALGFVHEGEMARLAGMWSGYFTGSDRQYIGLGLYNATAADFDSPWGNLYTSAITNAKLVLADAEESGNRILAGHCKVIIALGLSLSADLWGDVPATEVGDFENIPTPKYDAQADVYTMTQEMLSEAIEDLNSNQGFIGEELLNFNVKGIYSIKARIALSQKNYQDALDFAEEGITSVDEEIALQHGTSRDVDQNTYYAFQRVHRAGYMSASDAFALGFIDDKNNAKTNYKHIKDYLYSGGNLNTSGFFGASREFPIATYYLTLLIKAESAARTGDLPASLAAINEYRAFMASGGYLSSAYQSYFASSVTGEEVDEDDANAVLVGMQYDAYDAADFQNGGILNTDNIAEDRAYIREILAEKYIASVGLIDGFTDLRRTFKETDVRVNVTPTSGTQIPLRFIYPQVEINTNPNTPEVVDVFTPTPVNQ
ncbi:SusD/RagB family nutrient-binding outer membrane lipoprotein [Flammeovirga sp. EKP202]|uniref:SusD/RagB family nutrient-binding outer membrane lipoprotein n=1 Tax=Flammeovirga sp. EKP202 TaxID=2770592 RepID=UPI00165FC335|nr:SusD/RagB family nutrient-binding outer membrane lipoprotein [Flammeovirga sp. EKP202]MBD0404164.1 SusD/RagB family nutrient-binding outer membrane lipoprotein [Flammeovirga sp. EKP202]